MNTKEIIDILEDELSRASGWAEVYETEDFFNSIIILLKEGEKYKEMWGELEDITGAIEWEMVDLKEIKQEYFPELIKEVK